MKKLIYAAALTFASITSVSPAWATGVPGDARVPHTVRSAINPNSNPYQSAHFYFTVHVAGRSLSQLVINPPEGIRLSKSIEMTDQSGKKLDATVSLEGGKAIVSLAQPVAPETILEIDMKEIRLPGYSQTWLFTVSSKLEGLNTEIPLGVVRFNPPSSDGSMS